MIPPPAAAGPPGVLTRRQVRERTERALATRARSSSGRRRQELLDYVVGINMGVAADVAFRYGDRSLEGDDLLEVARVALTRAARDYDPICGDDFLSHAVAAVRAELSRYLGAPGRASRPLRDG